MDILRDKYVFNSGGWGTANNKLISNWWQMYTLIALVLPSCAEWSKPGTHTMIPSFLSGE